MIADPLNNYPQVYRGIGGKQVITSPDIPDATLCIGDAELQAPVPILYKVTNSNQSMKADIKPIQTMDDLFAINAGGPVKKSDFAVDYYFGEAVE